MDMDTNEQFFNRPILNSPYEYPGRGTGSWTRAASPPTRILERTAAMSLSSHRSPEPKKSKGAQIRRWTSTRKHSGIATEGQQYELAQTINSVRNAVDRWRALDGSGSSGG